MCFNHQVGHLCQWCQCHQGRWKRSKKETKFYDDKWGLKVIYGDGGFKHEFSVHSWRWYHFWYFVKHVKWIRFFQVFCWSIQELSCRSCFYVKTMNAAWIPYHPRVCRKSSACLNTVLDFAEPIFFKSVGPLPYCFWKISQTFRLYEMLNSSQNSFPPVRPMAFWELIHLNTPTRWAQLAPLALFMVLESGTSVWPGEGSFFWGGGYLSYLFLKDS